MDVSISQTFGRTILTTSAVFTVLLVLFVCNVGQDSPLEGMAFLLLDRHDLRLLLDDLHRLPVRGLGDGAAREAQAEERPAAGARPQPVAAAL